MGFIAFILAWCRARFVFTSHGSAGTRRNSRTNPFTHACAATHNMVRTTPRRCGATAQAVCCSCLWGAHESSTAHDRASLSRSPGTAHPQPFRSIATVQPRRSGMALISASSRSGSSTRLTTHLRCSVPDTKTLKTLKTVPESHNSHSQLRSIDVTIHSRRGA